MGKNIVKKLISLSLTIVFFVIYAIPSMAKSPITFNEKIQTENRVISYEIEISPNSNICALSFELTYSESQAKLLRCDVGKILDGGIAKYNSPAAGKMIFTYISTTPLEDSGAIISIDFEALSSDNENIDVACEITECINQACDEIAYTFSESVISNPIYQASNKMESDKNTSAILTSSSNNFTAENIFGNSDENIRDESLANSDNESNHSADNNSSKLNASNAEKNESNRGDVKHEDNEEDRSGGNGIIKSAVAMLCFLTLAFAVYFAIVRPIMLKRRNENEKK